MKPRIERHKDKLYYLKLKKKKLYIFSHKISSSTAMTASVDVNKKLTST